MALVRMSDGHFKVVSNEDKSYKSKTLTVIYAKDKTQSSAASTIHQEPIYPIEIKNIPYGNFPKGINAIITSYLPIPDVLQLQNSSELSIAESAKLVLNYKDLEESLFKKSFLYISKFFQQPLTPNSETEDYHELLSSHWRRLLHFVENFEVVPYDNLEMLGILKESLFHLYQATRFISSPEGCYEKGKALPRTLRRYLELYIENQKTTLACYLIQLAEENKEDQKNWYYYEEYKRHDYALEGEKVFREYKHFFVLAFEKRNAELCNALLPSYLHFLSHYDYRSLTNLPHLHESVTDILDMVINWSFWRIYHPEHEKLFNRLIEPRVKKLDFTFMENIIDTYHNDNSGYAADFICTKLYNTVLQKLDNNVCIPVHIIRKINGIELQNKIKKITTLEECAEISYSVRQQSDFLKLEYDEESPACCFFSKKMIPRYSRSAIYFINLIQDKAIKLINQIITFHGAHFKKESILPYLLEGIIFYKDDFKYGVAKQNFDWLQQKLSSLEQQRTLSMRSCSLSF